ncbi:MAG: hypothetical protein HQ521_20530 [Bacteroidetes bacterium]|nr:hypothetical protein [Bacteroidota bacterium]
MNFPEECIRGAREDQIYLENDNYIAGSNLFYFNKLDDPDSSGWKGNSINWKDDENAIEFTLNQEKNGKKQFNAGAAIVPHTQLKKINRMPLVKGRLQFERDKLDDNPYHGNLLLGSNVTPRTMKVIAACIAAEVTEIVLQNN